ncbi:MAG: hypothetical protein HY903_05425 [Deltaproteobacteria bacterium]|nr:hypothetical protein [Deltaproteobacteria bacterium]
MASPTRVYMQRNRIKAKKAGKKRKQQLEKHGSTPTRAALFGESKAKS